jgi:hypothetical protein
LAGPLTDFLNSAAQPLETGAIGLLVVIAFGLFIDWRRARARLGLGVGKPMTFDASLRANAAPYPRRWRMGWMTVNAGPPTWRPRFSVMRRPVGLPMSAVVEKIRAPSLREGLIVNTECRIIVARAGDVNLELAVFPPDLPAAQQALESGSARGSLRPSE